MTDQTPTTAAAGRITLDAGGRAVQKAVVTATLLLAAASFTAGIPGLVWAGQGAQLWALSALVPIVVDAGLVVAALSAAVRHSQRRRARTEAALLLALTALSVAVQGAHAWDDGAGTWPAVAVAAILPIVTLVSTHSAMRAVLSEPVPARKGRATAAAPTKAATPAAVKAPVSKPDTPRVVRTPRPVRADAQPLAELIPAVRSGAMSQRQAAELAGVSRHAVAAALA